MADAKPTLKIAKIVTHKPVKIPVTVEHDLNADLEAYAKVYKQAHGEEQSVNSLIPQPRSQPWPIREISVIFKLKPRAF